MAPAITTARSPGCAAERPDPRLVGIAFDCQEVDARARRGARRAACRDPDRKRVAPPFRRAIESRR